MGIYKNKKGLYSLRGKYKDEFGEWKSYHRYTGLNAFTSKKEAERVDLELRDKLNASFIDQDSITISSNITFLEIKKQFLIESKYQLRESTIIAYKHILKRFESLDNLLIKRITHRHITPIFLKMAESGLSVGYMDKCYFSLNRIFKYAIENDYLTVTPMDKVKRIKRPNELKKDFTNFLTNEEFNQFIEVVKEEHEMYYVFFMMLYFTGMRKGEITALQWNDIDFEKETYEVKKSCMQKAGQSYKLGPPKTLNSYRVRQMPKQLLEVLKTYYEDQQTYYGFSEESFIFGMFEPLKFTTIDRYFAKYKEMSGINQIKHVTIHGFRHSFVSYLSNQGIDAQAIAYMCGNTTEQILKTYSHFFPNNESKIMHTLENALFT